MFTIRTNNIPRPILSYYDLSKFEQDQVIDEMGAGECENFSGFKFKGQVYNLEDFVKVAVENWSGVFQCSAFHGVLVRLSNDANTVVVGEMFS